MAGLLRDTVCREGLAPSRIARHLAEADPATLTWLPGTDPADKADALVRAVRTAVDSLDDSPARRATELLVGLGRTRGLLRKHRRQAAASALDIGAEYFRKHREYPLLLDLAEQILRPAPDSAPDPEPGHQEPTPLVGGTPRYPGDNVTFIGDITIPDGTVVAVREEFVKVWEIRNTGTIPWRNRFARRSGPAEVPGLCWSEQQVPIADTRPGELVRITVRMVAPGLPSTCRTDWKMVDEQGNHCFPNKYGLYSIVHVIVPP